MTTGERRGSRPSAVRIRIVGRVQGVGFRYFVIREARRLGLSGYARNLDDGSVEIRAEGDPAALDGLVGAARRGPPGARVDGVDVDSVPATGEDAGFGVRW